MINKSHRRRTNASKASLVAAAVAALSITLGGTANADPLDAIAHCESGGNPRATNGSHFGLFQFDMSTWRSVGGRGNPMNASPAEQHARARALLAQRGTQPWNASKHCWAGKTKVAKIPRAKLNQEPKIRTVSDTGGYTIRTGDTLGKIAARHGTTVDALMAKNPQVSNPHRIRAGGSLSV